MSDNNNDDATAAAGRGQGIHSGGETMTKKGKAPAATNSEGPEIDHVQQHDDAATPAGGGQPAAKEE